MPCQFLQASLPSRHSCRNPTTELSQQARYICYNHKWLPLKKTNMTVKHAKYLQRNKTDTTSLIQIPRLVALPILRLTTMSLWSCCMSMLKLQVNVAAFPLSTDGMVQVKSAREGTENTCYWFLFCFSNKEHPQRHQVFCSSLFLQKQT